MRTRGDCSLICFSIAFSMFFFAFVGKCAVAFTLLLLVMLSYPLCLLPDSFLASVLHRFVATHSLLC